MISFFILLRSLYEYILKQLFLPISVNKNIYLDFKEQLLIVYYLHDRSVAQLLVCMSHHGSRVGHFHVNSSRKILLY